MKVFADRLVEDNDSFTNFIIPTQPFKVACGYDFQEPNHILYHHPFQSQQHSSTKNTTNQINPQTSSIDIRRCFQKMRYEYNEHRIDQAYAEACKLTANGPNEMLSYYQRQQVARVKREMKDVLFYQAILHQDGWELKKQKKNLRVSTKIQGHSVAVLVQAFMDVEIQNFFSVLVEIDYMKKWMPFMQSSKLQKIVARNCRIGHIINDFPFIAKRETFFQGIGYDRVNYNNTVFLFTRSLNKYKDLQKQLGYEVHESPGTIQLDYKYLVLQYTPETPKSGTLKMALNVDMRLKVPMFILAPASEGFGVDFYYNVLKIAKNLKGSIWQQKIQNNPDFFNLLQRRIRQHFYERRHLRTQ